MRIKRNFQPRSTIEQFAEMHGLTMEIRERSKDLWGNGRFIASFEHCEEKGDGVLIGAYGNGNTEEEAIEDYGRRISGKMIVLNASTQVRKEMRVPIIERA